MSEDFRLTRTVAFRLFVLITSVAVLVLAVLTVVVVRSQKEHLMDHVLKDGNRLSDVIARSTRHSMLLNRKEHVQTIISSIGGEPGIEGIRIYNKQGSVVFATTESDLGVEADLTAEACVSCHYPDSFHEIKPVVDLHSRIYTRPDGLRILGIITPIRNEPTCSTAPCHAHPASKTTLGVLDLTMSLADVDEQLSESTSSLILLSLFAVLAVGIVSGIFIWIVVYRPVHRLIRGMKHVASGNLDHRIDLSGKSELVLLAEQFNIMTGELHKARSEILNWSRTLESKVEEKTQEVELAHRQMLHVEKMASLGNLAASVAHELNNPLEGILTFSRLLLRQVRNSTLPPDVARSFEEDLTLVAEESERCGSVVKNLLLFARQGGGVFEEVSMKTIIERCVAIIGHHAAVNNVEIQTSCSGEVALQCDRSEMEQVLIALSVNAIEAMSVSGSGVGGGVLTIEAELNPEGHFVVVRIRDSGIGISNDVKQHIFEPFFTTKSQNKGVGLGLAVVHGIVRRHHGKIEVDSAPGKGTTFSILLPVRQPAYQGASAYSDGEQDNGNF